MCAYSRTARTEGYKNIKQAQNAPAKMVNLFRRVISLTREKKLKIALTIILSVVGFVKVSNENYRKKSKINIVRS